MREREKNFDRVREWERHVDMREREREREREKHVDRAREWKRHVDSFGEWERYVDLG